MNMNTCEPSEFSAAKTPDTEVAFAVRASMSFLFTFPGYRLRGTDVCSWRSYSSPFQVPLGGRRKHTLSVAFMISHKHVAKLKRPSRIFCINCIIALIMNGKNLEREWGIRLCTRMWCGKCYLFEATQEEKCGDAILAAGAEDL